MAVSTAVDLTAVARVVGIKTEFVNLRGGRVVNLPQRLAVFGQGSTASTYSTDKFQVTTAYQAATRYGFGSPIHLAVQQLLPVNGDGVGTLPVTVYPLIDAGGAVTAAGSIAPSGTATVAGTAQVVINNIRSQTFGIAVGDTVADVVTAATAAINAELGVPVIAVDATPGTSTTVDLTAKWAGPSGNDVHVEIVGGEDTGITFVITQPTGGSGNPNIDGALAQIGNVWETMLLNCLDIADTTTLDKYQTAGEGRWGALVRKPFLVFTGNTATSVSAATAVSDARKTDRVNAQLVSPASNDLPLVVAARQLARITVLANNNPPHDYGSQTATGLTPGADGDQWDYVQRDQAVKAGSSTIEVRDGVVNLSDVVTFYHPTGDVTPAYRYVVDVVKVTNILFNLDLRLKTPEWDGAPLIPDDQPTTNRSAKKPKQARAELGSLIDQLALEAIISDPASAKAASVAQISGSNPKRLDVATTMQISSNTNIISVDFNWGFYFGG
jgi:phage tail sheath gpL-like